LLFPGRPKVILRRSDSGDFLLFLGLLTHKLPYGALNEQSLTSPCFPSQVSVFEALSVKMFSDFVQKTFPPDVEVFRLCCRYRDRLGVSVFFAFFLAGSTFGRVCTRYAYSSLLFRSHPSLPTLLFLTTSSPPPIFKAISIFRHTGEPTPSSSSVFLTAYPYILFQPLASPLEFEHTHSLSAHVPAPGNFSLFQNSLPPQFHFSILFCLLPGG